MRNAAISFPMLGNWTINPSATYIVFGHTFYWYGAIMAAALLIALFYGLRISKRLGLKENDIIDTLLLAAPMTVIGCRLYYVAVNFNDYRDDLLGILRIWEGGLAMYGGLLFAFLSVLYMCRRKKISWRAFMDMAALGLMLGQIIGRWGNFINREAFGVETEIFCRMGLSVGGSTVYVHPLFLYEMLWNLVGFVVLNSFLKRRKYDGQIFLGAMLWYGLIRLINDGIRQEALFLPGTEIASSQIIGGVTALAALALLIIFSRKPHPQEKLWVNIIAAREEKEAPSEEKETPPEENFPQV